MIVHLIGIPLTGTSVNPARSLGPALVVGGTALSQVWLFIVAPLVGAIVAALHPPAAGRQLIVHGDGAGRGLIPPARPLRSGHGPQPGTGLRSGPPAGRPGHHPRQRTAPAVQHHVRAGRRGHTADLGHRRPGQDGEPAPGPEGVALRRGRQLLRVRGDRGDGPALAGGRRPPRRHGRDPGLATTAPSGASIPTGTSTGLPWWPTRRLVVTLEPERAYGMGSGRGAGSSAAARRPDQPSDSSTSWERSSTRTSSSLALARTASSSMIMQ